MSQMTGKKETSGKTDKRTGPSTEKGGLKDLFARLADFLTNPDRYEPAKHYMRGPGPATLRSQAEQDAAANVPEGSGDERKAANGSGR